MAHDDGPDSPGDDDRARELASTWVQAVAATTYVPMSLRELQEYLYELVRILADALVAQPFSAKPGVEVGRRMVAGQLVGLDSLRRSIALLVDGLLDLAGPPDSERVGNLAALLGAVSAGYAEAMRTRILEQQEDMKRALLGAKHRAEQVKRAAENLFREVFAASPTGIAITDVDGRFFQVNPALAEILACQPEDLPGESLVDFIAEDDPGVRFERPRGRRKLVRRDGESAWVYVAMSPLRDGTGVPSSYVTTVQDLSELQLLQGRFGHQLLHDALTGVANRLYFESALETRLGRAAPDASITLCCLNLDALAVLNAALGHSAGDRLLRTVATRLGAAVAQERALVARTGGDEFAILIEDSPGTPEIPELVARFNEALSEPEYVDGTGIAAGASIGVVRCPAGQLSGAALFRAGDAALRAARASGRRQWMQYDPLADESRRRGAADAAALPGAFENGELEVSYQPLIRLADRKIVAMHAALWWPGRADGPLDGEPTMVLAERTGHSVLFGPWMLRRACENLPLWRLIVDAEPDSVLRIRLSRLQSADDDLVAAVIQAIEGAGLPPHLLELAFDTGAVLEELGSAPDNLQVIAEIGVRTALCRFNGGPRELALLDRSPASSVILTDPYDDADELVVADSPVTRAVARLITSITELGAVASVGGVRTEEQAAAWARMGVDTAQGPLFGEPAGLEQIMCGNGEGGS